MNVRIAFGIAAVFLVWSTSVSLWAEEILIGRVIGVHDGDTLTLLVDGRRPVKVRLAGIDAPELTQPYGQQARQDLSVLVFGQEVEVESAGLDRYGRALGVVHAGAINVNAELVNRGAAWVYRQYPHPAHWEDLEALAQRTRTGLWRLQFDQRVPPWEWRHHRLQSTDVSVATLPAPPADRTTTGADERSRPGSLAEIHRCPNAQGGITFQQQPCTIQAPADGELLEKQRRNAVVVDGMTRQDVLYQEGSLAGMGGGDRGSVHVRSYTRSDGTSVSGYTRSLPAR